MVAVGGSVAWVCVNEDGGYVYGCVNEGMSNVSMYVVCVGTCGGHVYLYGE